MSRIRDHLHLDAMTVTGKTLGENIADAEVYNDDVIRTVEKTDLWPRARFAVLKGNLAPDGCVIKPSACEPRFLKHTGARWYSTIIPSMKKAVDDPDLDVTADHVLILRAMPVRKAGRACRNGACCRSRPSWSSRACATWCGCRMRE